MTDTASSNASGVIGATTVWVDAVSGGLGARIARLIGTHHQLVRGDASSCDVAILQPSLDGHIDDQRRQRVALNVAESIASLTAARHVVLVSSAMVYGAWENNPIPLTEDAVLRPDVEFSFARDLSVVEEMVDQWRREQPGRSVTVLRPALAMAADGTSGLARALAAGMGQRRGEEDPPAQFLHLDDLASAVLVAVDQGLDGVYNVAPDGWVPGERVRALAGAVPRLKLPDRALEVATNLRWRFQRGPIPPGLRSYTRWPWLVANDRLRAAGWVPTVTNEQAYVEGTEAKWWTLISPKRRQEISLGALVGLVALAAGVAVAGVRRFQAHRRTR